MATKTTVIVPAVGGVDDDGVPWTGGRRTVNRNVIPSSPFCTRPLTGEESMQIYSYATTGLSRKYKGGTDNTYPLCLFGAAVSRHLKASGMDGVFYFKDPADDVEKSIIDYHARFSLEDIKKATKDIRDTSDAYDVQNLDWSSAFLIDSLAPEQQLRLSKYMTAELNGPVLWMCVILENQYAEARAMRTLVKELESLKLASYVGENVKACTRDIDAKCRCLEAAQRLPDDIGFLICEILTKCSVKDFRIPFFIKLADFDLHQTPQQQEYHSLLKMADQHYQSLLDSGDWLVSTPNPESKDSIIAGLVARIATLEQRLANHEKGRGGGKNRHNEKGKACAIQANVESYLQPAIQ